MAITKKHHLLDKGAKNDSIIGQRTANTFILAESKSKGVTELAETFELIKHYFQTA